MSAFADKFEPLGTGQRAAPGSLRDKDLASLLERYKREVAKRYRIIAATEIEQHLPKGNLLISTKLDGELWYLVKRGAEVVLCAPNGRVITGIPLLADAAKRLAKTGDVIIAGELFAIPPAGRPRVQHVARAIGDGKPEMLAYQAFDLVDEGGESRLATPYAQKLATLRGWLGEVEGQRLGVVTTVDGDAAVAANYYREWVASQKFEGIVVRTEQGVAFKIKPTFTIDAVVIAFGERMSGEVAEVRELELALMRDDGSFQFIGPVGNGFSIDDRVAWQKRLSAMTVPSGFRMANRDGTLCRFVRPEIVVEVQLSDLIETDADDRPIRRMQFAYDATTGYSARGDGRVPALLFPIFKRERTDKTVTLGNIGLEQFTERLPAVLDGGAAARALAKSEVVRRAAYVKEMKGQLAVRKFIVIETHKREAGYPPFLVHFTDFSAGRAKPLETAMRAASTREKADAHVAAWLEENIKKGWSEAGAGASASSAAPGVAAAEAGAEGASETAEAKPKKRAAKKPAAEK